MAGGLAVRLKVLAAPARPFSERENARWQPTLTGLESEWFPYEQVAPLPFKIARAGDDG